uniref:Uncharacterized protein n=1 Tax=Arundo donax TaxID=35708 RepID=A0A0A9AU47_ARUDO
MSVVPLHIFHLLALLVCFGPFATTAIFSWLELWCVVLHVSISKLLHLP